MKHVSQQVVSKQIEVKLIMDFEKRSPQIALLLYQIIFAKCQENKFYLFNFNLLFISMQVS